MTAEPVSHLLLGPQRPVIQLSSAVADWSVRPRSLAVISAGWQEAESYIDDVAEATGLPVAGLEIYARAETLFAASPALLAAYRHRQDRLQEQQRLYGLRLRSLANAARHTLRESTDADLSAAEQRHAIAQLRALDRHHLRRTEAIHEEFELALRDDDRVRIAQHVTAIEGIMSEHDAVLITGGNVIVLLNRMRLFGLGKSLAQKPVMAWSAGAMALARRVVLYHDRMPQGLREPELLGAGLGIIRGHIILPDPVHRLRSKDKLRLGLMSRRLRPDACVTLDNGAAVEFVDGSLHAATAARRINAKGRLVRFSPA